MIGGLSSYSPGAFAGYGSAGLTRTAPLQDGEDVCTSLDCKTHGAMLKARLQASFPGLQVLGVEGGEQQGGAAIQPATARPVAPASGSGLTSGQTLLTAQEQQGGSRSDARAPGELSEEEKQQVAKLKQTDAKVRAHERAHAAVGGQHAGAPSYEYVRGPDGQMYAVGGEVAIDISPENDPEATLQKAQQVAAAALAPADPSGADRAVAAAAARLRLEALAQIREEKRIEQEEREQEQGDTPGAAAQAPGSAPPVEPGGAAAARAAQAYSRNAGAGQAAAGYLAGLSA